MLTPEAQPSLAQVQDLVKQIQGDATQLLAVFHDIQKKWRWISPDTIALVAEALDIPVIHAEGVATFYHFFTSTHAGNTTIYVNTCTTSEMAGSHSIVQALESELKISMGQNSPDQKIGLRHTSCIGMCDQEPAILINGKVFPRVTPEKVKKLIAAIQANQPLATFADPVLNPIRAAGPVFFSPYESGKGLRRALEMGSLEVIEKVRESGLRGRGGAGFPTGQKWGFCRATEADARIVICNGDEGEPGTFKDRALFMERAEMIFEGMIIAGYAIEAKQGFLYLRAEYEFLLPHLESVLARMRRENLLGKRILGTRLSFDIQIKLGAGAYICGEESALIESAEGKRGQPRNRPPFPVTSGYLRKPTIVNNPETFGCVVRIAENGAEWFRAMGTQDSAGVKLLSIAGDCDRPGIYELEWGKSVREVLELCGARDVLAVQIGGPSGACISEKQFDRKITYSDLSTGGAFTVFGRHRDLLSIVHNHMEFFRDESCGFCVPCRAGNTLLVKAWEKIMVGNGTVADLRGIQELSRIVKTTSRCGLGQTSPNPLLTTIENFPELIASKLRTDVEFASSFDLDFAVADAIAAASRNPNLETKNQ